VEESSLVKGGSISGRIIEKESKKPIANITLQLTIFKPGEHIRRKEIKTDGKGRYRFESLEPCEYRLEIIPLHPYCYRRKKKINNNEVIILKKDEDIVCNGVLEIGGSVSGFVYKAPGVPFNDVFIEIKSYPGSLGFGRTKEDGSFFIGSLCESDDYFMTFSHKINGHSNKFVTGVQIEKVKNTRINDIVFNFKDVTGVEGDVRSSIDLKLLTNARLSFIYIPENRVGRFRCGEAYTDKNGHFYMRNLKPGKYSISTWWPVEGPKRDPKTGKPLYSFGYVEMRNRKRFFIDVEQGKISKIDININIPSNIITEGINRN
jgi:hypothetical protein